MSGWLVEETPRTVESWRVRWCDFFFLADDLVLALLIRRHIADLGMCRRVVGFISLKQGKAPENSTICCVDIDTP